MTDQLTDRQLRAAKSGAELSDSAVKGLRLRVANNGLKTFFYRYRSLDSNALRRVSIGHFGRNEGQISLEQARKECLHLREIRRSGVDPQAYRRQLLTEAHAERVAAAAEEEATSYTVGRLCQDYLRAKSPHWRPAMERETGRLVEAHILSRWRDIPVTDLRRAEISDALDAIAAKTPIQSNRFLWLIKSVLDFGVEKERLGANPAAGLKRRTKEKPRERVLDDKEIKKLITWLGNTEDLTPEIRQLTHFLLLTGCRLGEACGARVEEFDIEASRWTIPEARNKSKREHAVILSRQALDTVRTRIADSEYLWPARYGNGHFRVDSASGAIRKGQASLTIKPWTAHDLRRTLATGMGNLGITSDVIGRVLNHSKRDVTGRVYDRATRDTQAKEAWQQWADHLDALTAKNVVPTGKGHSA